MNIPTLLHDLLFGRVDSSFYRENRKELRGTNYRLLRKACMFGTGMCFFLIGLTLLHSLIGELTVFYISYTVFFAFLTLCVCTFGKRDYRWIPFLYGLFVVAVFLLVILAGTYYTPDLPGVTFHVFLLIIPLLYVTRPICSVLITVVATIGFCIASAIVKGAGSYLFQVDMLNALCCCLVGIGADITIANLQLENIYGKFHFRRESATDPLTGLPNRRHFDLYLGNLFSSRLRPGEDIALLMGDIDNFKSYNDTYGHLKGDECLRQVAHALERSARVHDVFLARFGGEEFVAAAVLHNPDEARRLAERFVEAVAALSLVHERTPYGHITISVGYAGLSSTKAKDKIQLLQCADSALYRAKAEGKNRACSFRAGM